MQHQGGLRKELRQRGIDPRTTIVTDNWQLLLTKETLLLISNHVSEIISRKLTPGEVAGIQELVRTTPPSRLNGKSYREAVTLLAEDFHLEYLQGARFTAHNPDQSAPPVLGEYQREELLQLTPDESTYSTRAHADRRGNAFVDRERVNGHNSAPHNIAPLRPEVVQQTTFKALSALEQFLLPTSIEQTLNKLREGYHGTFLDIELARQGVQLDSRYRKRSADNPDVYTWDIHPAGFTGTIGDVRTQDTIQQVVALRAGCCSIPLSDVPIQRYYGCVRLFLREFATQSIQATQFLTPVGSPTPTNAEIEQNMYHFEFTIETVSGGRAHLKPVNDLFMFRKPLARVERLTTVWRSPYELMVPQADLLTMTMTFGNPTLLAFAAGHNLVSGDLVYIENSASGSAALDATFTRHAGYIVTYVDPQTVSIPVDSSALVGFQLVQVFLGAKRFSLQLEFICLQQ